MSTFKHTPGPWRVLGIISVGSDMAYCSVVTTDDTIICTLRDRPSGDAHLIAAAPELLNLAERVARLNRDAGRIGDGMLAHLIDEARAAIAKATQEPQT